MSLKSVVHGVAIALVLSSHVTAQQGKLTVDRVRSVEIAGNLLGESADIEVAVYTPPGYDDSGLTYPVLYLLHGIGGTYRDWTEGGYQGLRLPTELDSFIASGHTPPMIVVMPTAMNRYFGSYYADSPVTGNWGRFVARELVAWTDANYRTLRTPAGRGIAGHSMGGFGALTLTMDHPDVYSAAYAMNPCCLELTGDFGPSNPAWTRALRFTSQEQVKARADAGDFYPVAIMGWMSVASPGEATGPFFVAPPYRIADDGSIEIIDTVFPRFNEFFPVERPDSVLANLNGLAGLALDTAEEDEFTHIPPGAASFSRRLRELGIDHDFEVYQGDHRNRMRERLRSIVLPFFSARLQPARP